MMDTNRLSLDTSATDTQISRLKFDIFDLLWLIAMISNLTFMSVHLLGSMTLIASFCMTVIELFIRTGGKLKLKLLAFPLCYLTFAIFVLASCIWTETTEVFSVMWSMIYTSLFAVGLGIYIRSYEKLMKMLHVIAVSIAFFSAVYLITSPISSYGTTAMGGITGQWRNVSGYYAVFGFATFLFLLPTINNFFYKVVYSVMSLLCVGMGFCTGSRKVILMILIMTVLFVLTEKGLPKKIGMLLLVVIALFGFYLFISNMEFLEYSYGDRLMALFDESLDDGSIVKRDELREKAFELFLKKPIFGYGPDAVRYQIGLSGRKGQYAHNNYAELLADFGIVGTALFYIIPIKSFIQSIKYQSKTLFMRYLFIMLAVYLFCDWGSISYNYRFTIALLTVWLVGCQIDISRIKSNQNKASI